MWREFTAVYKKSGKWISAWIEEIPGVNTQGLTKKEAEENLKEALSLVLSSMKDFCDGEKCQVIREPIKIKLAV